MATVVVLEARATDDAVELFDVLMTTELLARAQRQTRDEQAGRYPRVSKDAGKLAAAVGRRRRRPERSATEARPGQPRTLESIPWTLDPRFGYDLDGYIS